jgi:hypothetical protein
MRRVGGGGERRAVGGRRRKRERGGREGVEVFQDCVCMFLCYGSTEGRDVVLLLWVSLFSCYGSTSVLRSSVMSLHWFCASGMGLHRFRCAGGGPSRMDPYPITPQTFPPPRPFNPPLSSPLLSSLRARRCRVYS